MVFAPHYGDIHMLNEDLVKEMKERRRRIQIFVEFARDKRTLITLTRLFQADCGERRKADTQRKNTAGVASPSLQDFSNRMVFVVPLGVILKSTLDQFVNSP